MLAILGQVPEDPAAVAAFARASRTLVDWWDAGDDRERRHDRNFHTEAAMAEHLQQFVMRATSASALAVLRPVLDAIDRHPREIHSIIQGLTSIEDNGPNTPHYWYLWGLFADGVKRAKWISRLKDEHPSGSEMLSSLFLTSWWKDNLRHWRSLEGYAHHVHALFEALPPSSIVLDDYLRFLYHIGERSLPEAFVRVANSLKRGDVQAMLHKTNTVFLLEVLLQRYVYGRPLELKRDRAIREAVLFLLDTLAENGSSAAFRMRDDFVTPGPSCCWGHWRAACRGGTMPPLARVRPAAGRVLGHHRRVLGVARGQQRREQAGEVRGGGMALGALRRARRRREHSPRADGR
jgi:hypothetical protein